MQTELAIRNEEREMKRLIAVMLLTGSAFAAQSCPVQVTSFGNYGNEFRITWENVSDKPTAGVRFGAYYTSVGEKHDFLQMLDYNGPPKGSPAYKNPFKYKPNHAWYVLQDRTNSGGVWVEKVAFRDGTSWQDDGSRSCVYEKTK
jgi:hypothetical protein